MSTKILAKLNNHTTKQIHFARNKTLVYYRLTVQRLLYSVQPNWTKKTPHPHSWFSYYKRKIHKN